MKKQHSANFKAKVALDASSNTETIAVLAKKYELHPRQVQAWKAELISGAEAVFQKKGGSIDKRNEEQLSILERKIGQLIIENDLLKKNFLKYPKKSD